jgi:hypothetical protein
MNLKTYSFFLIPATLLIGSQAALAQDEAETYEDEVYEQEVYEGESVEEAEVYAEPPQRQYQLQPGGERVDGVRFRGGVAFAVGGERVSNADFRATLFGFDGRLGVQINDLVGLYVQPHLSFGPATERGLSGFTGTFAMMAMVDFTFLDSLFVGGGFGYGVMNNPSGAALGFRVGGYPLKSIDQFKARRRGLMLAFDLRPYFLGGFYGTGVQYMFSVGYEAY